MNKQLGSGSYDGVTEGLVIPVGERATSKLLC